MLRDVRDSQKHFGGITTVLAGDPRQCLPVIPKGSPGQVVDACVMNAGFWKDVELLELKINTADSMAPETPARATKYAWLLSVGNGSANRPNSSRLDLPEHLLLPPDSRTRAGLIEHVYPLAWAALASLGQQIASIISSKAQIRRQKIPTSPAAGLCNGTRLLLTRMQPRVLEAVILTGDHAGKPVLLPRITEVETVPSADLPFTLYRKQFPVRLAMAMTINKSQGQSLVRVGVCLENPVFAHGQLYVALSRASDVDGVKVLLPRPTDEGAAVHAERKFKTINVLHKRVCNLLQQ